jgi:hypothetical protein
VNKEITARVSNMDNEGGPGRQTVTGRATAGMNLVADTAVQNGMTSVTWVATKGNPDAMAARAMAKAVADRVITPAEPTARVSAVDKAATGIRSCGVEVLGAPFMDAATSSLATAEWVDVTAEVGSRDRAEANMAKGSMVRSAMASEVGNPAASGAA